MRLSWCVRGTLLSSYVPKQDLGNEKLRRLDVDQPPSAVWEKWMVGSAHPTFRAHY